MQKSAYPRGIKGIVLAAAAFTAAVIVLVDQSTKHLFLSLGDEHHRIIIKNVLETIHHENHGIIANLPLPLPLTISVTIIIMALIVIHVLKYVRANKMVQAVALAEIFGGALGNLIDRVTRGYVFDWILLFGQSAINIADIAIIEGAVVYVGWTWVKKRRSAQVTNEV